MQTVRRSIRIGKIAAILVLAEQAYEMVVLGISLAEHPLLVAAALGALGFPVPDPEAPSK